MFTAILNSYCPILIIKKKDKRWLQQIFSVKNVLRWKKSMIFEKEKSDYVKIFIKKICIKSIKFFIVPNSSLYKGHVYGEVKLIFCYFYA